MSRVIWQSDCVLRDHVQCVLLGVLLLLQCLCKDPAAKACGSPDYKGDGNCDDDNNNKGCDYDDGDCCAKTVNGGKVSTAYCKEVS